MSAYKSHTKEQVDQAIASGAQVWALDTGNDGADDHLIGTREEVERDLLDHHEISELPAYWTLDRVN